MRHSASVSWQLGMTSCLDKSRWIIRYFKCTPSPVCPQMLSRCLTCFNPLDKIATFFTDDFSNCISMNENLCISIRISLKFVPKGPIDNKWALVQVMAWRQIGNKPLSEAMLIHFTNTKGDEFNSSWIKCFSELEQLFLISFQMWLGFALLIF